MAEAPATTRGIHPAPHLTTTAAHSAHPLKDALSDTLTGTSHTDTTTTCLDTPLFMLELFP